MNIVTRTPPTNCYAVIANRPIRGVVLHNTVGYDGITPVRGASWHYLISRNGTIYRDVPEQHAAHHVGSTDEWRPPWILRSPVNGLSDANYCTLGVELVSTNGSTFLAWDGYTEAQYQAMRELCADLSARYLGIPFVGHGQLQLDRTDPVGWDYQRGGLGPLTVNGRYYEGDDMATIAELEAQIAALNGVNTQLALERDTKDLLLQSANSHIGALEHDVVAPLRAENESLKEQLAGATPGVGTRIASMRISATLTDGKTQDLDAVVP